MHQANDDRCPSCRDPLLEELAEFAINSTLEVVKQTVADAMREGDFAQVAQSVDPETLAYSAIISYSHLIILLMKRQPEKFIALADAMNRHVSEAMDQPLEMVERTNAELFTLLEAQTHGR